MAKRLTVEEKEARKAMRDAIVAERRAKKAMAKAEAKMAKAEARDKAKMEKEAIKASRPKKGSEEMKEKMARVRAAKKT